MLAALQPRAHSYRFGDAARERSLVDVVEEVFGEHLGFDVGGIFDDHVGHLVLLRAA